MVVVPTVLARLDLTGMVVMGDAMQTQRHLSRQIVEAGGDEVWFVKDTHPSVRTDIAVLFTPIPPRPGTAEVPTDVTHATQIDTQHGQVEERRITVRSWLQDESAWPYRAQVFKLERSVWRAGKATTEVRSGVTRVPAAVADAERVLTMTRAEWGMEHGLQYRRTVQP